MCSLYQMSVTFHMCTEYHSLMVCLQFKAHIIISTDNSHLCKTADRFSMINFSVYYTNGLASNFQMVKNLKMYLQIHCVFFPVCLPLINHPCNCNKWLLSGLLNFILKNTYVSMEILSIYISHVDSHPSYQVFNVNALGITVHFKWKTKPNVTQKCKGCRNSGLHMPRIGTTLMS